MLLPGRRRKPGAVFQIDVSGSVQALAGGPTVLFRAQLLLDPADARVSSGTGALDSGSVSVQPGKIVIDAVPAGMNPNAAALTGVTWSVLLLTGANPLHAGAITPGQPYLRGLATVPTSGNPVQVGAFSGALSTDFS